MLMHGIATPLTAVRFGSDLLRSHAAAIASTGTIGVPSLREGAFFLHPISSTMPKTIIHRGIRALGAVMTITLLLTGTAAAMTTPTAAPMPVRVTIPGGTDNTTLDGWWMKPDGAGPFPAVVALHGCGGLTGHDGGLDARSKSEGTLLALHGIAVLFPDSYGMRGIRTTCLGNDARRSQDMQRIRVGDAAAAAMWLRQRSDIRPDDITLLGWSAGAIATLHAIDLTHPLMANAPHYARAVAFYPDCRRFVRNDWSTRTPLLILIGAADDWTPAPACAELVNRAQAAKQDVRIVMYPGAYHDFDAPAEPVHLRAAGFGTRADGRVHVGSDPQARADALQHVLETLGTH